MKSFLVRRWQILIILAISLAPFFWLSGKYVIYGPDTMWSLNGTDSASQLLPTWKSNVSFGYGWSDIGRLIHDLFITGLRDLGISYPISQKIVLSVLIFSCGIFTYMFMQEILVNKDKQKNYALVAALIFVLNPFAITWIWWRFLGVIYAYPCWPLLFYIITRIINDNITYRKITLYVLLLSLYAPGVSAPIILFSLIISGTIYLLARLTFMEKSLRKPVLKKVGLVIIVYAGINAYWFLPGLLLLNHSISNALTAYDPNAASIYNSQFSTITNTLKLWGATALHINFFGQSYFGPGTTKFISSSLLQLLLFTPFLIILIGLYNLKNAGSKARSIALSLTSLLTIGIFLMKGIAEPLSSVNKIFLTLPLGAAFRIPYDKFGYFVAFSYATLIPYYLTFIKSKFVKITAYILVAVYILVPLIIFFKPYSLLTNDKQALKGVVTEEPRVYKELSNSTLTAKDRILVLPTSYNGESSYNWPKGVQANSHDILSDIVPSQIIFLPNGNSYSDSTKDNLSLDLFSGLYDRTTIKDVLDKYGITDIFIHKDWNGKFELNKEPLPAYYIPIVKNIPGVKLIKNNNYFSVYSLIKNNNNSITAVSKSIIGQVNSADQLDIVATASDIQNNDTPVSNGVNNSSSLIDLGQPIIDNGNITYRFKIKSKTNQLYINKTILNKFTAIPSINIDGKTVMGEKEYSSELELYTNDLEPGSHTLSLVNIKNVAVKAGNFDALQSDLLEDWQCGKKFKDNIKEFYNSVIKSNVLDLTSTSKTASCHMVTLDNPQPDTNALMSIQYKTVGTDGSRIVVYEDDGRNSPGSTTQIINEDLTPTQTWKTVYVHFYIQPGKEYRPILYSGLTDGVQSESEYSNLHITLVPSGFDQLITVNDGIKLTKPAKPLSTSTKYYDSGSLRVITTKSNVPSYVINSNQSYDPDWQAYYAPDNWQPSFEDKLFGPIGLKKLSIKDHVVLNGYSDGWYINDQNGRSSKIVIFYYPQKIFYIGILISLMTITAAVFYLIDGLSLISRILRK